MTYQMLDALSWDTAGWWVLGSSGSHPFQPEAQGLRPVAPHTACWRGYIARYALKRGKLYLADLHVELFLGTSENSIAKDPDAQPLAGPEIMGVLPEFRTGRRAAQFNNKYRALGLALKWTGRLLVGRSRLPLPEGSGGWPSRYDCSSVFELSLVDGRLTESVDRSVLIARFRELEQAEMRALTEMDAVLLEAALSEAEQLSEPLRGLRWT